MKKLNYFETEISSVISHKAKWTINDGALLGRVLTK
jgi:hypothetical protein